MPLLVAAALPSSHAIVSTPYTYTTDDGEAAADGATVVKRKLSVQVPNPTSAVRLTCAVFFVVVCRSVRYTPIRGNRTSFRFSPIF